MKEHGKDSWWYYFDRIGKTTKAQCKVPTCKKVIDQGPTKATNKLECHLKNHHKPLYEQREKAKKEVEQRKQAQQNKLSFNRKISEMIQEEAGTSSAKEVEECVTNENAEPEDGGFEQNLEQLLRTHGKTPEQAMEILSRMAQQGRNNNNAPQVHFKCNRLGQSTIMEAFTQWRENGEKTLDLEDKIMLMIATDGLPLRTVEKAGFNIFLSHVIPQFKIKNRRYYRENVLPRVYENLRRRMIDDLSTINYMSLTFDSWESKSCNHSLLAITAHFIDAESRPNFVVLDTVPVKEMHKTAEVIANHTRNALNDLNIDLSKIQMICRDGAQNIVNACKNHLELPSFHCLLHQINLCIKAGLVGSVESERVFSSARFILNDLRQSLTPENLKKLLFLHQNVPLYNFKF